MAKQAARKQQLRTWKLQQQRKQEDNWRQEDEDRRKREEEIRRIRDLSNQDEQYNRFMKLVGGRRTRSRVGGGLGAISGESDLLLQSSNRLSAFSPETRTSGSVLESPAWTRQGTSTSTTTMMRLPWIQTVRPAPQVSRYL